MANVKNHTSSMSQFHAMSRENFRHKLIVLRRVMAMLDANSSRRKRLFGIMQIFCAKISFHFSLPHRAQPLSLSFYESRSLFASHNTLLQKSKMAWNWVSLAHKVCCCFFCFSTLMGTSPNGELKFCANFKFSFIMSSMISQSTQATTLKRRRHHQHEPEQQGKE